MIGFFKSKLVTDSRLGVLTRSGSTWKGVITFGSYQDVELRLSGNADAPNSMSVELARRLAEEFPKLEPQIAAGLFEHYLSYREAASSGEFSGRIEQFPEVARPEDVWPYVYPSHVLIAPLRGAPDPGPVIEIACGVAWDEEHVVGARIQQWHLIELCGSV